jgi:hypothetical protein
VRDERDEDFREQWFGVAFGALIVAAVAVRAGGLGTTLFEDEVWVANLVRVGRWAPHGFLTPPLFYWLVRAWTAMRGCSDVALREPAALMGVLTCLVPLFAPRPRLTRFIWATLLAFSSPLLFYSERLKQYTLEAFVATILVVLFLRMHESRSRAAAFGFFAAAAIAIVSLYPIVFLIAAMAFASLRRRTHLVAFALLFALFGVAYIGWLSPGAESTRVHGDMIQFFAIRGNWATSPSIFISATNEWLGQVMNLVPLWWLVTPALALFWLASERRDLLLLTIAMATPLAVAAASSLHLYPYGEIRLMIFVFPAIYLLLADALALSARRAPWLLLLLVPFVIAGVARDTYNVSYMRVSDMRSMYKSLAESHRPGEPIYANRSQVVPLDYYFPQLRADLHSIELDAPRGGGWYLQQTGFRTEGADLVLREGDVVLARVR